MIIRRNQTLACALRWDGVHDRIELVMRVIGKVHLCYQARKHGGAKYREMDVRWTPGIGVILPGIGTRTNCQKPIDPLCIGQTATHPQEVRIKRPRPLIPFMEIAASSIGLPDLQECV